MTRDADLDDILTVLSAHLTSQLATQLQEVLTLLKESELLVVDLEVSPFLTGHSLCSSVATVVFSM